MFFLPAELQGLYLGALEVSLNRDLLYAIKSLNTSVNRNMGQLSNKPLICFVVMDLMPPNTQIQADKSQLF